MSGSPPAPIALWLLKYPHSSLASRVGNCCNTQKPRCPDFPRRADSSLCSQSSPSSREAGKTKNLLLSASQLGIALLFICIHLGGEGVFTVCPRPSDTEMETKTPHCARPPLGRELGRELGSCWVQPPHRSTESFRSEKIFGINESHL